MKALLIGLTFAAAALTTAMPVEAKGCIKGAFVGGVAGHLAGHGKMGALAGCAIGHHNATKKDKSAERRSGSK